MDKFDEKLNEYMNKKENPHKKFVKDATAHLIGISRAKAKNNMKNLIQHHEALDKIIHVYTGKEGLRPEEKA